MIILIESLFRTHPDINGDINFLINNILFSWRGKIQNQALAAPSGPSYGITTAAASQVKRPYD